MLLTAEDVILGGDMLVADFRDDQALFYATLGGWLGISKAGVMVGKGTPELIDGIWYVELDESTCSAHPDHRPDVSQLSLRRIG